jgi:N-acetylglutamate synthase-like GNAT family acetyltransferase
MQVNSVPIEAQSLLLREPKPGDLGWVIHRQGEFYWREYQYDQRFEGLVASIIGDFAKGFNSQVERCWIAEANGQIVGCVFLVQGSVSVAKLRLLYVEPFARGQGIGQRLIAECIRFARDVGYRKVSLWTQSELSPARHLYAKAGFVRIQEEPHTSFGREDLIAETWELTL